MWIKVLLLFFVFSYLFRTDLSFDQDLGRHIKLGEIITQTFQVPKTNLFSYTNPDFPFINTHWLFEVWAFLGNKLFGVEGLLLGKVIIFLVSVWLILKTVPKEKSVLLLPISFIFLHVLRERLELRPEIFSFLLASIELFILDRFLKAKSRWIFCLPLIQLIWINTHIYFFVGFILQAIFIIYTGYQATRSKHQTGRLKLLGLIFVLSAFLSLLNPNGVAGLLYPLTVNNNYGYTIVENQTMFFLESISFRDPNFLFVKISLVITFLGLFVAFLRRHFELKNILLALSGVALALLNVRSFPYLVFLSLPATLQNFGAIKSNKLTKLLTIFTIVLLILESYFYLNGDYYKYTDSQHQVGLKSTESVKGAMDFVLKNDLPGPIFNNFDIGSYILYRGYPKYRVFVDGRPEGYPKTFLQEVYIGSQYDYAKFKNLEEKYSFKTIIFSHTDQTPWGKNFLQNVVKDPDWKTVYVDDFVIVLIRKDTGNQPETIDLSKLSPDTFKFTNSISYIRLGIFLLGNGYTEAGKQFILEARSIFPEDPVVNQIMGNNITNYFFW